MHTYNFSIIKDICIKPFADTVKPKQYKRNVDYIAPSWVL